MRERSHQLLSRLSRQFEEDHRITIQPDVYSYDEHELATIELDDVALDIMGKFYAGEIREDVFQVLNVIYLGLYHYSELDLEEIGQG